MFLNEKSLGRKKREPHGHLEWQSSYEPGQLRAVGYLDGEACMQKIICTTGEPDSIVMEADRNILMADGCDTACIRVSILDVNGGVVPTSDNLIRFAVQGSGRILGGGNGDLFGGKCLCIVQEGEEKGEICLKAASENLGDATCHLILT